ncbi:MAG: HD domain-containing protein [Lachnospiraceae bacterium]|nr:HD domain-containing protein [Lachnospiraceae bacterium]
MKKRIEEILDGDILASDALTPDYKVLLAEGTVLKKDYINKMKILGITHVSVRESEITSGEKEKKHTEQARENFKEKTKEQVKSVLEKHIYKNNTSLQRLCQTADEIINNVLDEEQIVEEIMSMQERSADLYEHAINCCIMSTITALHMNYEQEIVRSISIGCLLHDIGLRYMEPFYVNKSFKEMTDKEATEYKKHPVNGYFSLKDEVWLDELSKEIILYHHEQVNGRGYPFHRKGKEIDEEIKLVSICDTYDELITGIGCNPVKPYKAIEYLKAFEKEKYDAKIVEEFLKITTPYPNGCQVLTNTGQVAVVLRQNKGFVERPVIKIIRDENGKTISEEKILDLIKEKTVFITDVLS